MCICLILSSDTFLVWLRKTMKNVTWPNQFPCAKSKECNKNSSISVYSRRDGLKRSCSKSDQHAWQRGNWCTITIWNRNVTCIYTRSILIKIPDFLKAPFLPLFFWDQLLYILPSSQKPEQLQIYLFCCFLNKNSPKFEIRTLTVVIKSPGMLDPGENGDSSSSETLVDFHQITRH